MGAFITISMQATAARFKASLQQFTKATNDATTTAVQITALNTLGVTRVQTPVDTGALRASWRGPRSRGKYTWSYGTTLPYAPVLEYGLYTRVGPRTTHGGGADLGEGFIIGAGIFSKQAPIGMMRKALAVAKPGLYQRLITAHQRQWGQ